MTLTIHHDDNTESPREWCNLGTMLCNHSRYDLGDKPNPEAGNHGSYEADFKAYLKSEGLTLSDVIYTPIYMYNHSCITLSSTPFSCSWDSGQLGWHYITKSKVRSDFDVKRISPKLHQTVLDVLEAELEIYNHYVQGNVYGFQIEDDDGNQIDSCWGFIGDLDEAKQTMYEYVDSDLWDQLAAIDYSDIKY